MADLQGLRTVKRIARLSAGSALLAFAFQSFAEGLQPIQLPHPDTAPGKPIMTRGELPPQVLSDLLAAAHRGQSLLPEDRDEQADIYVVLPEGIYRWDAKANILGPVLEGDHRVSTGNLDYVRWAPLTLVYVADFRGNEGTVANLARAFHNSTARARDVFNASDRFGLEVVVRAWMDRDAFASAVRLPSEQRTMLAETVGYRLLDRSATPRLPGYMMAWPQTIPDELILPDAPKTARRIDAFRGLTRKMTSVDLVRRCGLPDELQGSGSHIYIYHMDDGSIVAVGAYYVATSVEALGYVNHITTSGVSRLLRK